MVTQIVAKFRIEFLHGLERGTGLAFRHGTTWAPARITTCGCRHLGISRRFGSKHGVTHIGGVVILNFPVLDFLYLFKTSNHYLHVGLNHRRSKSAKLLLILVMDNLAIFLLTNVMVLKERGDLKEGPKEGVALHTELQICTVGSPTGDLKTRQDEHANVVILNILPVPGGNTLPRCLGSFTRLPNYTTALIDAFQRIGVGESLGIAAKHHVHVVELAVYLNTLRSHRQEIVSRCPFLLRTVLRVGHNEEFILQLT